MQLQMPVWTPAINHKERLSKVKARPDGESRGQRDFFMINSNLQNILGRYIYFSGCNKESANFLL